MLIVAGDRRVLDCYLDSCRAAVEAARSAPGCLDYARAADPVEPDCVTVYERWTSGAAVQSFRGTGPGDDLSEQIISEQTVSEQTVSNKSSPNRSSMPTCGNSRVRTSGGCDAYSQSGTGGRSPVRSAPSDRPMSQAATAAAGPVTSVVGADPMVAV